MAERRVQPLELADADGNGTGRFRLFAINPADSSDRLPCCDCQNGHATCAEAEACDKVCAAGITSKSEPAEAETPTTATDTADEMGPKA